MQPTPMIKGISPAELDMIAAKVPGYLIVAIDPLISTYAGANYSLAKLVVTDEMVALVKAKMFGSLKVQVSCPVADVGRHGSGIYGGGPSFAAQLDLPRGPLTVVVNTEESAEDIAAGVNIAQSIRRMRAQ